MIRPARHALLAAAALVVVAGTPAAAEPYHYRLDPDHLSIAFKTHHIGFADTIGLFRTASGSFVFDETVPAVSEVRIEVQAASVFTNHERRDAHLRGGDFLAVDAHPVIRFAADSVTVTGPRTGTVTGDLTLLGVTRPVTLDLTWNKSGRYPFAVGGGEPNYVVGVSVRGTITRSEFGMTYAAANGWVGDEVQLLIELEAIRGAPAS